MPRKICIVVTARPSYSRVKTLLDTLSTRVDTELQLVVAASALLDRYGNALNVIMQDGFEVAAKVFNLFEGESLLTSAKTTGFGVVETSTVFDRLQPDLVVTIADRCETLATAIAASYMNIPLAHIQGGEVTGNIDDKVRDAVTMLADFHFPATQAAQDRIISMGVDGDNVFKTGCPSIDLVVPIMDQKKMNRDTQSEFIDHGVGAELDLSQGYNVVLQHPVTTEVDQAKGHVTETLHAVRRLKIPTLWFWPNPDAGSSGTAKGIRAFREMEDIPNIRFFKNLKPEDFISLLRNSQCVIGNSSVGIRECSFLGVPAVNIGSRQAGRERGQNVVDVDYCRDQISRAIQYQVDHGHYPSDHIYGDGKSGKRIATVLAELPLGGSVPLAVKRLVA